MLHPFFVEGDGQLQQVLDGIFKKILLSHHRWNLIQQLLHREVITWLNGNGINTIRALLSIRSDVQLMLVAHLRSHLAVLLQAFRKEDIIRKFVDKLHKVTVLAINLALVEIAEWHFNLIGLPYITGFYKFFEIHI